MITAEQLREWQAVCDKATPGPWRTVDGYDIVGVAEYIIGATDVDFMIAARVAMPALLEEFARRGLWGTDGIVCPRCGEVFHDADIHTNPDEYWQCPYCFTWQHTRCRGPIDDDTEAAAIVREIERLRALLREWDAKCKGHCDVEDIAGRVAETLR